MEPRARWFISNYGLIPWPGRSEQRLVKTGACAARCRSGSRSLFVRPRERQQPGCARFNQRDNSTQRETARCEDVAQGQSLGHQPGLHRWRPGLAPEPLRSVRPDEIVEATQELDVPVELVCATGVAGRAPAQVRRPLPNREVEALDERGVQRLGILGRAGTRPTGENTPRWSQTTRGSCSCCR